MAGSRKTAIRVTPGAIVLSSSSHFPLKLYSDRENPVATPPGRARLSTKPAPTGSVTLRNTIGTVFVACSNGGQRSRPRPGERARADRFQEEALRPAGRAAAARGDHRVELVRAHHERNPVGRCVPSGALGHRPSVQSAPLDPAGRDRRRGKDLGSDNPACSGILYIDRTADGAPQQGNARPCCQPPAG